MILNILKKIQIDKAEGIMMVSYWPAQPWFPLFKKLLIDEPIYFKPNINLLIPIYFKPNIIAHIR